MTDSSTTAQANVIDLVSPSLAAEVADFVSAVAATKKPKPTTRRMVNPTKDHTGDQYKGPRLTKSTHNIGGRTYEFSQPTTRSEAVKLLASPDESNAFTDIGAFTPVLAVRKPGSKKKWLKLKSKYSPRH